MKSTENKTKPEATRNARDNKVEESSGYMTSVTIRVFVPADPVQSEDPSVEYMDIQEEKVKEFADKLMQSYKERVSVYREAEWLSCEEYSDGWKDVYDIEVELK